MIKSLSTISYKKLRHICILVIFHLFLVRYLNIYVFAPEVLKIAAVMFSVGFSSAVILFGLSTRQIEINLKQNIWLFLFLSVFIVSSVLNLKYGFSGNIKSFGWTAISFFAFFLPAKNESLNDKEKLIKKIQNILIVYLLIYSSISLLTFVLQTNYFVQLSAEDYFAFGYLESRLHGVYPNPNGGAFAALLSIIFSCRNLLERKKPKFYIFNIIIQFCYISLANSRGVFMVLTVILFLFLPLFFYGSVKFNKAILKIINYKGFKSQTAKKWYIIICSVCGTALVFALLHFSMKYTRELFSYIPKIINLIFFNGSNESSSFITNKIQTNRMDFVNNHDISNLRFSIWINAWELFKTRPFFGVSPQNVINLAKEITPFGIIVKRNYSRVHSVYIDILLCTGIFGFSSMAIFYVQSFWRIIKFHIKNKFAIKNAVFISSVLSVFALMIFGAAESIVVLTFNFFAMIFWVFFDYILSFCKKENASAEDKN